MWGINLSFLALFVCYSGCSHIELKLLDDIMLAISVRALRLHGVLSYWLTRKGRDWKEKENYVFSIWLCGCHIKVTGLTKWESGLYLYIFHVYMYTCIHIHTYIYMTYIWLLFFFLSAMADTNQMAFTALFLILRFVKTKQKTLSK